MITKLTPEQVDRQQFYVEKYIQVGISTEPVRLEDAHAAANGLYKLLQKEVPKIIEIHPGPRAAWHAVCEYATPANLPDRDKVVEELKREIIYPAYEGNFNAGFLAYAEYMKEIGVKLPESYELYKPAEKVHLTWPLDNACIFSDRPYVCKLVDNQLHCDDGPAFAYHDGTKIWCLNGVGVDEQIVMSPQTQNVKQIDGDNNGDRRAIRIERFGWPRYLHESGAVCLDEGPNDVEGTYEVLYRTNDSCRLIATCVTGRIMTMGVPVTCENRQQAQEWLRGPNPGQAKLNILART